MIKLQSTHAWILLCVIIEFAGALSAICHGVESPYATTTSPWCHQKQQTHVVSPTQNKQASNTEMSCISSDASIFEILKETKDKCQGVDYTVKFYIQKDKDYFKIGTVTIDKKLFHDVLMKYGNWMLTSEKIDTDNEENENNDEKDKPIDVNPTCSNCRCGITPKPKVNICVHNNYQNIQPIVESRFQEDDKDVPQAKFEAVSDNIKEYVNFKPNYNNKCKQYEAMIPEYKDEASSPTVINVFVDGNNNDNDKYLVSTDEMKNPKKERKNKKYKHFQIQEDNPIIVHYINKDSKAITPQEINTFFRDDIAQSETSVYNELNDNKPLFDSENIYETGPNICENNPSEQVPCDSNYDNNFIEHNPNHIIFDTNEINGEINDRNSYHFDFTDRHDDPRILTYDFIDPNNNICKGALAITHAVEPITKITPENTQAILMQPIKASNAFPISKFPQLNTPNIINQPLPPSAKSINTNLNLVPSPLVTSLKVPNGFLRAFSGIPCSSNVPLYISPNVKSQHPIDVSSAFKPCSSIPHWIPSWECFQNMQPIGKPTYPSPSVYVLSPSTLETLATDSLYDLSETESVVHTPIVDTDNKLSSEYNIIPETSTTKSPILTPLPISENLSQKSSSSSTAASNIFPCIKSSPLVNKFSDPSAFVFTPKYSIESSPYTATPTTYMKSNSELPLVDLKFLSTSPCETSVPSSITPTELTQSELNNLLLSPQTLPCTSTTSSPVTPTIIPMDELKRMLSSPKLSSTSSPESLHSSSITPRIKSQSELNQLLQSPKISTLSPQSSPLPVQPTIISQSELKQLLQSPKITSSTNPSSEILASSPFIKQTILSQNEMNKLLPSLKFSPSESASSIQTKLSGSSLPLTPTIVSQKELNQLLSSPKPLELTTPPQESIQFPFVKPTIISQNKLNRLLQSPKYSLPTTASPETSMPSSSPIILSQDQLNRLLPSLKFSTMTSRTSELVSCSSITPTIISKSELNKLLPSHKITPMTTLSPESLVPSSATIPTILSQSQLNKLLSSPKNTLMGADTAKSISPTIVSQSELNKLLPSRKITPMATTGSPKIFATSSPIIPTILPQSQLNKLLSSPKITPMAIDTPESVSPTIVPQSELNTLLPSSKTTPMATLSPESFIPSSVTTPTILPQSELNKLLSSPKLSTTHTNSAGPSPLPVSPTLVSQSELNRLLPSHKINPIDARSPESFIASSSIKPIILSQNQLNRLVPTQVTSTTTTQTPESVLSSSVLPTILSQNELNLLLPSPKTTPASIESLKSFTTSSSSVPAILSQNQLNRLIPTQATSTTTAQKPESITLPSVLPTILSQNELNLLLPSSKKSISSSQSPESVPLLTKPSSSITPNIITESELNKLLPSSKIAPMATHSPETFVSPSATLTTILPYSELNKLLSSPKISTMAPVSSESLPISPTTVSQSEINRLLPSHKITPSASGSPETFVTSSPIIPTILPQSQLNKLLSTPKTTPLAIDTSESLPLSAPPTIVSQSKLNTLLPSLQSTSMTTRSPESFIPSSITTPTILSQSELNKLLSAPKMTTMATNSAKPLPVPVSSTIVPQSELNRLLITPKVSPFTTRAPVTPVSSTTISQMELNRLLATPKILMSTDPSLTPTILSQIELNKVIPSPKPPTTTTIAQTPVTSPSVIPTILSQSELNRLIPSSKPLTTTTHAPESFSSPFITSTTLPPNESNGVLPSPTFSTATTQSPSTLAPSLPITPTIQLQSSTAVPTTVSKSELNRLLPSPKITPLANLLSEQSVSSSSIKPIILSHSELNRILPIPKRTATNALNSKSVLSSPVTPTIVSQSELNKLLSSPKLLPSTTLSPKVTEPLLTTTSTLSPQSDSTQRPESISSLSITPTTMSQNQLKRLLTLPTISNTNTQTPISSLSPSVTPSILSQSDLNGLLSTPNVLTQTFGDAGSPNIIPQRELNQLLPTPIISTPASILSPSVTPTILSESDLNRLIPTPEKLSSSIQTPTSASPPSVTPTILSQSDLNRLLLSPSLLTSTNTSPALVSSLTPTILSQSELNRLLPTPIITNKKTQISTPVPSLFDTPTTLSQSDLNRLLPSPSLLTSTNASPASVPSLTPTILSQRELNRLLQTPIITNKNTQTTTSVSSPFVTPTILSQSDLNRLLPLPNLLKSPESVPFLTPTILSQSELNRLLPTPIITNKNTITSRPVPSPFDTPTTLLQCDLNRLLPSPYLLTSTNESPASVPSLTPTILSQSEINRLLPTPIITNKITQTSEPGPSPSETPTILSQNDLNRLLPSPNLLTSTNESPAPVPSLTQTILSQLELNRLLPTPKITNKNTITSRPVSSQSVTPTILSQSELNRLLTPPKVLTSTIQSQPSVSPLKPSTLSQIPLPTQTPGLISSPSMTPTIISQNELNRLLLSPINSNTNILNPKPVLTPSVTPTIISQTDMNQLLPSPKPTITTQKLPSSSITLTILSLSELDKLIPTATSSSPKMTVSPSVTPNIVSQNELNNLLSPKISNSTTNTFESVPPLFATPCIPVTPTILSQREINRLLQPPKNPFYSLPLPHISNPSLAITPTIVSQRELDQILQPLKVSPKSAFVTTQSSFPFTKPKELLNSFLTSSEEILEPLPSLPSKPMQFIQPLDSLSSLSTNPTNGQKAVPPLESSFQPAEVLSTSLSAPSSPSHESVYSTLFPTPLNSISPLEDHPQVTPFVKYFTPKSTISTVPFSRTFSYAPSLNYALPIPVVNYASDLNNICSKTLKPLSVTTDSSYSFSSSNLSFLPATRHTSLNLANTSPAMPLVALSTDPLSQNIIPLSPDINTFNKMEMSHPIPATYLIPKSMQLIEPLKVTVPSSFHSIPSNSVVLPLVSSFLPPDVLPTPLSASDSPKSVYSTLYSTPSNSISPLNEKPEVCPFVEYITSQPLMSSVPVANTARFITAPAYLPSITPISPINSFSPLIFSAQPATSHSPSFFKPLLSAIPPYTTTYNTPSNIPSSNPVSQYSPFVSIQYTPTEASSLTPVNTPSRSTVNIPILPVIHKTTSFLPYTDLRFQPKEASAKYMIPEPQYCTLYPSPVNEIISPFVTPQLSPFVSTSYDYTEPNLSTYSPLRPIVPKIVPLLSNTPSSLQPSSIVSPLQPPEKAVSPSVTPPILSDSSTICNTQQSPVEYATPTTPSQFTTQYMAPLNTVTPKISPQFSPISNIKYYSPLSTSVLSNILKTPGNIASTPHTLSPSYTVPITLEPAESLPHYSTEYFTPLNIKSPKITTQYSPFSNIKYVTPKSVPSYRTSELLGPLSAISDTSSAAEPIVTSPLLRYTTEYLTPSNIISPKVKSQFSPFSNINYIKPYNSHVLPNILSPIPMKYAPSPLTVTSKSSSIPSSLPLGPEPIISALQLPIYANKYIKPLNVMPSRVRSDFSLRAPIKPSHKFSKFSGIKNISPYTEPCIPYTYISPKSLNPFIPADSLKQQYTTEYTTPDNANVQEAAPKYSPFSSIYLEPKRTPVSTDTPNIKVLPSATLEALASSTITNNIDTIPSEKVASTLPPTSTTQNISPTNIISSETTPVTASSLNIKPILGNTEPNIAYSKFISSKGLTPSNTIPVSTATSIPQYTTEYITPNNLITPKRKPQFSPFSYVDYISMENQPTNSISNNAQKSPITLKPITPLVKELTPLEISNLISPSLPSYNTEYITPSNIISPEAKPQVSPFSNIKYISPEIQPYITPISQKISSLATPLSVPSIIAPKVVDATPVVSSSPLFTAEYIAPLIQSQLTPFSNIKYISSNIPCVTPISPLKLQPIPCYASEYSEQSDIITPKTRPRISPLSNIELISPTTGPYTSAKYLNPLNIQPYIPINTPISTKVPKTLLAVPILTSTSEPYYTTEYETPTNKISDKIKPQISPFAHLYISNAPITNEVPNIPVTTPTSPICTPQYYTKYFTPENAINQKLAPDFSPFTNVQYISPTEAYSTFISPSAPTHTILSYYSSPKTLDRLHSPSINQPAPPILISQNLTPLESAKIWPSRSQKYATPLSSKEINSPIAEEPTKSSPCSSYHAPIITYIPEIKPTASKGLDSPNYLPSASHNTYPQASTGPAPYITPLVTLTPVVTSQFLSYSPLQPRVLPNDASLSPKWITAPINRPSNVSRKPNISMSLSKYTPNYVTPSYTEQTSSEAKPFSDVEYSSNSPSFSTPYTTPISKEVPNMSLSPEPIASLSNVLNASIGPAPIISLFSPYQSEFVTPCKTVSPKATPKIAPYSNVEYISPNLLPYDPVSSRDPNMPTTPFYSSPISSYASLPSKYPCQHITPVNKNTQLTPISNLNYLPCTPISEGVLFPPLSTAPISIPTPYYTTDYQTPFETVSRKVTPEICPFSNICYMNNLYRPTPELTNNMKSLQNIIKTNLNNYIKNNDDMKSKLFNSETELSIPIGNIIIAKKELTNTNSDSKINQDINLKKWPSNVKLVEAKLQFKFKDISVTNFQPVVCNFNQNDLKNIENFVKKYIESQYGNVIVAENNYTLANEYELIKNCSYFDEKCNLLWPVVTCKKCF